MFPLPKITLTASDYPRLEQLARRAVQQGNMDAIFLMTEINRAEVIPNDTRDIGSIVTVGSWVTYWTYWGAPRKIVQLVWPEDCTSDLAQISVMSSLGAALIGLRPGDQMPYFVAGCMNVVRIERVNQSESVRPFRTAKYVNDNPIDEDPGPTAA